MSVSDAERRRQERRQRILNNQESRLKKILGSNSSFEHENLTSGSTFYDDEPSSLFTKEDIEVEFNQTNDDQEKIQHTLKSLESFLKTKTDSNPKLSTENNVNITTTSHPISSPSSKSVDLNPEQHLLLLSKQIPMKIHHLLLVLIGLILSLFLHESYFLIYFIVYQISIFVYGGCICPIFYSTKKSALLTLCILFGVPQFYRDLFEKITHIATWFSTDLSIFITSALLPTFLSSTLNIII